MKKLLAIVLLLALTLSLAACGEDLNTKFEKKVIADVTAEIDRVYLVYEIDVTIRSIKVEDDTYYASGYVVMEGRSSGKTVRLKTDFEGKYILTDPNPKDPYFFQSYLNIDDDDWSFA